MADRSAVIRRAGIALAWRPEWPVAVVVALGWVLLAVGHAASAHHHHGAPGVLAIPVLTGVAIGGWALMSVAMMGPVALPAVRHVGLNSIRRRRQWAMAVYVASYLAVWVMFGVLALALVGILRSAGVSDHQLVVGALVVATGWQLTKWKRRAVLACRRTVPLPPTGWRADYGCVRFGFRQAGRCVVSCGPLMLLMAVIGHSNLIVMAALTAAIVAEQRAPAGKRLIPLLAGALAMATVWTILFG
ncbi:MAG: DUF2182 domain-containing protein [Pseudonocardiaceae bacterium]